MDRSPPFTALFVSLAAWLGLPVDHDAQSRPVVQRMMVQDELILHVPFVQYPLRMVEWVEHKGPKCLSTAMIAGAARATPASIDFVLRNRSRVRAVLDRDCDGLDFYGGFYVEPEDNALCARRDEIRSRVGSTCRIERFRTLEAKLRR